MWRPFSLRGLVKWSNVLRGIRNLIHVEFYFSADASVETSMNSSDNLQVLPNGQAYQNQRTADKTNY